MAANALLIADVVAAVVTQLKDITAVAARFVANDINAYDSENPQSKNRTEATVELLEPAALVACTGAGMSNRGGLPCWRYNLLIILRLEGTAGYQAFFTELVNGIPSNGSGLRWLDESPLPNDLDPPDAVEYHERHDSLGVEYWEFSFSLTATGG